MSPHKIIAKKIGELLIERKVITEDQLRQALAEQGKKGGYVSQHLISLGFATEFDIANCLSSQYGFAYIPLKEYAISPDILEIIPLKFIKIYTILPIDKMGDVLTVAMADPLNDGVIETLKQLTNYNIEVVIGTFTEINNAIDRYFGLRIKELGKMLLGEEDLIKENIAQSYIQTLAYSGVSRRRYKRVDVDLDMSYSLQGNTFKTKVKNISYVGVYFVSDLFMPIDTNIPCKIYLKDTTIDALVQVARVEKIKETKQVEQYEVNIWLHGIAGLFSFITDDDKKKLSDFLSGIIR